MYARSRADDVVAAATECVVQDDVTVSFGASPFLIQHMTGHYGNISIETAGNQIRDAKGMKAQVDIDDVRLQDTGNSKGTIGALNATITWTADGIKQTVQNSIPLVGGFVTGVKTNPSDGTIELEAALGSSITTKPTVQDGGIALKVVNLSGLGFTLPRETVQPALDAFSTQLTKNYPLGIKADDVQVTDSGVTAHFSTRNASIPAGNDDPCFALAALNQPVEHRAGARQPEPGSARIQHRDGVVGGADAAARLDPDAGTDGGGHQLDCAHRCAAAWVKSC